MADAPPMLKRRQVVKHEELAANIPIPSTLKFMPFGKVEMTHLLIAK
jgi:hypothetical protein